MNHILTATALAACLISGYSFAATDVKTEPRKDFFSKFSEKWEKIKQSEPVKAAQEKYEKFKQSDEYKKAQEQLERLKQDEKVQQQIAAAKEKAKATGSTLLDKAKDFFGIKKN